MSNINLSSLVSIVIPTYNRQLLLTKCLHSIINQTYLNFEIIIVDDGSTDETGKVIKELSKNHANIKYINDGNTKNISKLRNKGISKAKGMYIAFCDDDDIWHPDKLMKQINHMNEYDFICTNADLIDFNDKLIETDYLKINTDQIITLEKLLEVNCILTPSVILNKNILESDKPFDELKYTSLCEDLNLWLQLASKTKIYFLKDTLISVRRHQSITNDIISKKKIVYIHFELISNFTKHPNENVKKAAYKGLLSNRLYLISQYLEIKNFNGAINEIFKLVMNFNDKDYLKSFLLKVKKKLFSIS